jgi:spermidine synthase
LLLSTTTPLLQAWYVARFHAAVPYRLFALSNLASLLALLGFPLLIEPWLDLRQLGWGWTVLYTGFVLQCVVVGAITLRLGTTAHPARSGAAAGPAAAPPLRAQLTWLALAAMGSVMLLAVTNHVTQNVASVPFLWVVPLSLYLVTFILAFDHPRWYVRPLFIGLLLALLPLMAWQIPSLQLKTAAPLFLVGLFVACMVCHGELARLKPDPRHLTRFYLMLSSGGALGAVLVAIVAPLALRGYFELNIALVALALLLLLRLSGRAWGVGLLALLLTGGLALQGALDYGRQVRAMERDFYGVVRTHDRSVDGVRYRSMLHGSILHGGQLLGDAYRGMPADYFGPSSGYGRLFAALKDLRPGPRRIGVMGLGAGVIAAYGRAGDDMTFYEISPKVIRIEAQEFSFLRDSPATKRIVAGDGRLSLERELRRHGPQRFDVLGIDAFAGDSVPMHLVTREAMALYLQHLAPDGVIVFQATNRYIDLLPVIQRLAAEQNLQARLVSDSQTADSGVSYWYSSTDQVLVTRNTALLQHPAIAAVAERIPERFELPTFTDARHTLLRILK